MQTLGDAEDVSNMEETIMFAGALRSMAEICNLACPDDKSYKVMVDCMRYMKTKVMTLLAGETEEEATHNNEDERLRDPPITTRRSTNRGNRPNAGPEKSNRARNMTCDHAK